jgi:hypothetical protein
LSGGGEKLPEFSYAARRGRPAVDPALRRIAFGAGGVSVLVIIIALVWSGEKPGIGFGPPPVILAPAEPLRVAPANPGGLTVPEANEQIMSGDNSGPPPQLAPAAPAPDLAQLSQAAGLTAPAPAAPPPAPAPVAPAPVPAGDVGVQLASASDEATAAQVWAGLAQKMPDLLGSRQPEIIPTVINGNSVWQLRLSGFADAAAAQAFCAAVSAKGASCTVAAF